MGRGSFHSSLNLSTNDSGLGLGFFSGTENMWVLGLLFIVASLASFTCFACVVGVVENPSTWLLIKKIQSSSKSKPIDSR
mmetsp:Transcript_1383/g.2479  ORF Transcript_1383/g.2479 Transcript_1383/m.2479 type:complete len:80 (-) Transcript_1383:94-333(-)